MSDALIQSMLKPEAYDHHCADIQLCETHISWILLTGTYAYKIKKPVNFGFLDYSTLDRRHHFCNEELRLNQRLAPELYLDVVAICGSEPDPVLNGEGSVIEFALKMRQFPSGQLLSDLVSREELNAQDIDQLATVVADFHLKSTIAAPDSQFGMAETVHRPVEDNFRQIRDVIDDPGILKRLAVIEKWSQHKYSLIHDQLQQRKLNGFIRECHGDLHLGNIVMLDGKTVPFDCIEFNDNLRWIDVMSEMAFLFMDLEDHGQNRYAWRLLNTYLEITGDYQGLAVFHYYLVYRSLVRTKVAALRLQQADLSAEDTLSVHEELGGYLSMAEKYLTSRNPAVLIMHGLSGSGKTYISQQACEALSLVRVRSDVERKRLAGLSATAGSQSAIGSGLYDTDSTRRTYELLMQLAMTVCHSGLPVIVDAAFLQRKQRKAFHRLSQQHGIPFLILHCHAADNVLHERITTRQESGNDASEANTQVLQQQRQHHDSLGEDEQAFSHSIDTASPAAVQSAMDVIQGILS